MLTGPMTTSPREQESNVLAVINHVSSSARGCLPLGSRRRGPLVSSLWGGPHLIPWMDVVAVLPRDARITGDAAFPTKVTTAARGLRPAGGGIFISGTIRHEFGDQAVRDVSESFHANQHGGDNVPNQGNAFPVSRNEGPRS